MKLTNKQIIIIIVPVGLLVMGYFIYTLIKPTQSVVEVEKSQSSFDVLPEPVATDTSIKLSSKKEIYDRESSSESIKNHDLQKSVASDDDFFSGNIPVSNEPIKDPSFSMQDRIATKEVEALPTPVAPPITKKAMVTSPTVSAPKKKKTVSTGTNLNSLRSFDAEGNEVQKSSQDSKNKNIEEEEAEAPKKASRREWFYANGKNGGGNSQNKSAESSEFIKAVIHNDQTVRTGGTVKMRITEDCTINGTFIPRNTYVSGICSFSTERVAVVISSIRLANAYVKTALTAYEADGIAGIYIPGGVNQEIASDAASSAVSRTSVSANIPLIGSISMGAGKKIADPSVKLPSNYKILLKSN